MEWVPGAVPTASVFALGLPMTLPEPDYSAVQGLELKIPPPVQWLVAAILAVMLARLFPQWVLPFAGHRALAVALALAGVASSLAGVLAFRRAHTTIDPHRPGDARAVVRTGIYRFTRNPMYLGLLLTLLGVTAWLAHPLALLCAAAFAATLTRLQIKPEERILKGLFGASYEDYLRRVRRWL